MKKEIIISGIIFIFLLGVLVCSPKTIFKLTGLDTEVKEENKDIKIGEPIKINSFNGDYELTINSIEVTEERNIFNNMNPEQVVVINYTYKNINYNGNLIITNNDFILSDSEEELLKKYSIASNEPPQYAPEGTKCTASASYATNDDIINIKFEEDGEIKAKGTIRLN